MKPQPTIITALAAAVFLFVLGTRDIVTSHEGRVAQTARAMVHSGSPFHPTPLSVPVIEITRENGVQVLRPASNGARHDVNPWLIPVLNGEIRLQKPPLPYWFTAVSFSCLWVDEYQARLPAALLGALATLLIYELAGMVIGWRSAPIAAFVWVTTRFIVDEYRKSMADPYLAFFTLAAIVCWISATRKTLILFYVALALGALAKGPVILATVIPPILIHRILLIRPLRARARARPVVDLAAHLLGVFIFLAITLPWPIYVLRHIPNAIDIWRYESVGELTGENTEKTREWWVYLGSAFNLALPWTILWISGFALLFINRRRRFHSRRNRRRLFAIGWQVVAIAFFSFATKKKDAYLLPMMPAQTLIIADALTIVLALARRNRFGGMQRLVASAQAMIGIGVAIKVLLLLRESRDHRSAGLAFGGLAIAACALSFLPIILRRAHGWLVMQSIGYGMLLVALLGYQRADAENYRSPRGVARKLHTYYYESGLPIVKSKLPEEVSFYIPVDLLDGSNAPKALLVVDDPKDRTDSDPNWLNSYTDGFPRARAVPLPLDAIQSAGRYKLFILSIDRTRT